MKAHPNNGCKGKPWADDDDSGRIGCLYCPHTYDHGKSSRYRASAVLSRGNVHEIVCLVPEPVAALDDDEFATVRGLA